MLGRALSGSFVDRSITQGAMLLASISVHITLQLVERLIVLGKDGIHRALIALGDVCAGNEDAVLLDCHRITRAFHREGRERSEAGERDCGYDNKLQGYKLGLHRKPV